MGGFDSIMVDMSHYEKEENLARTSHLVRYCHERGIATEAEPGRIEGGEDGVQDTGDLESLLTTPEEAMEFVQTGIDFLAPAFGNVHGNYGGVENMKLDFSRLVCMRFNPLKSGTDFLADLDSRSRNRLAAIGKASKGRVQMVLHGTNGFPAETMRGCVQHGMTRCNVNELVLWKYGSYIAEHTGKVPITELMESGTTLIQERIEWMIDVVGSAGKAA
jgi:fructose-bisphosphate aldolase class II